MSEMSMPKMRVRVPPQMSLMDFRRYLLREEIPTGKVSRFAEMVVEDMRDGWWITPDDLEAVVKTFRSQEEAEKVHRVIEESMKKLWDKHVSWLRSDISQALVKPGVSLDERVERILAAEIEFLSDYKRVITDLLASERASQQEEDLCHSPQ